MALRTCVHEGVSWNVSHRLLPPEVDVERGWLVLESESEKRRLIPAPDGWEVWSDAELCAALARAVVVSRGAR